MSPPTPTPVCMVPCSLFNVVDLFGQITIQSICHQNAAKCCWLNRHVLSEICSTRFRIFVVPLGRLAGWPTPYVHRAVLCGRFVKTFYSDYLLEGTGPESILVRQSGICSVITLNVSWGFSCCLITILVQFSWKPLYSVENVFEIWKSYVWKIYIHGIFMTLISAKAISPKLWADKMHVFPVATTYTHCVPVVHSWFFESMFTINVMETSRKRLRKCTKVEKIEKVH